LCNYPDMESLSFSDARANLKAVMDRVVADKAPIAITRYRGEGVVLVPASNRFTLAGDRNR
jgi:antitoxin YefM